MLKISYVGCHGLSLVILAHFVLEMCAAAKNREEKSIKPPYFDV